MFDSPPLRAEIRARGATAKRSAAVSLTVQLRRGLAGRGSRPNRSASTGMGTVHQKSRCFFCKGRTASCSFLPWEAFGEVSLQSASTLFSSP